MDWEPTPPPPRRAWRIVRYMMVMVGATVATTLAINAGDNIHNLSASLIGNLLNQQTVLGPCPKGMIEVDGVSGKFCIDMYPASPDPACPNLDPQTQSETRADLDAPNCVPRSVEGVVPWTNISQNQAVAACAKAGKRLPTNKEYYLAAIGTPEPNGSPTDADCYVGKKGVSHAAPTGGRERCLSSAGVADMVGNVWEWVDATVYDGVYNGHTLPAEGYIKSVDQEGVPAETDPATGDANYGDDYFWNDPNGTHGMFRGGYWGIGSEAGAYTTHTVVPPSFTGAAVGFRCVK